ncbi:methionine ABC transporter permease [Clostridium cylindrosporum]|uniref:Putative D-methionine transport system permease protein MetI n=1 Tax=Clostridium cylindrosporum DSM 605 TaxID=1121307 RepID=A0A0J8DDV3_CLOCY|nr:methionine ABC transporter permease [Clostridium cylindrosporum]KMT22414.1 putative D-methionine transport system permease protein MetI [Clostridium cylindrosporum DSM 605]
MTITTEQLIKAFVDTLYMVSFSLLIGVIIAIPLAVTLVLTRENGILQNRIIYNILNFVINILRSLPFIILLVAIMPFTKLVVGTSIGIKAAIVPLIVYIAPYIARLIENSLLEVDRGIIETSQAMGATPYQVVRYFLLPEALPSLVLSITTATIGLIGATAMAGTVGAGGVGDLAISYGYARFDTIVMVITVVILIFVVQFIQNIGNLISKKIRH